MRRPTPLTIVYALLALAALVATWTHNLAYLAEPGPRGISDFMRDAYANHAAASLSSDVLLVAVAAGIFMVVEGRRVGVRHVWVYLVLSALVAVSVMFPLFLIARERRLRTDASA